MKRKALITGINGQDGSYLAEFLNKKGYDVHGFIRRNSVAENQTSRINHILESITVHQGDLNDFSSVLQVVERVQPDEVYNLAAQSHVKISFESPLYTAMTTGVGALNIFEACRLVKDDAKIYQASSSEMFGNSCDPDGMQRETTSMLPASPYACSKVFAHKMAGNYRNAYDMFISCGILFNHESPRRGSNFVTSKIVKGAVAISLGTQEKLSLGNLNARRDWGHAKDYVEAMWMMLQQDTPEDYVCASGVSHSVRDVCEHVFKQLGMDYKDYVEVDPKFFRPEEVLDLRGDSSKMKREIDWKPKYNFYTMLDDMIEYELSCYGVDMSQVV